jgi:hypothetical protein
MSCNQVFPRTEAVLLTDLSAVLPALELLEYRTFFLHHFVKKMVFAGNVQQITTLRKDGNGILRCVAIDRIVCSTTITDLNETKEDVFDVAFDTDEFNGVEERDCATLIQRFLRGHGIECDFGR